MSTLPVVRNCFFLICLLAVSHVPLPAQTPSALDTAPGATTAPGTNAPAAATPEAVVPPPPAGTSLITNGDFALATKSANWPDDWNVIEGGAVTWQPESGKHFFRLMSQKPEQHVEIDRVIDIPPGVTAIELSVTYRTAGLKPGRFAEDDARMILEFLDTSRKPIGAAPQMLFSAEAKSWTTISERVAVPPGTLHLELIPCLYRMTAGTLDLAGIQVTTLGETESAVVVKEAATAAAAKLAEQTAILDKEMAMPSISPEIKVSGNRLITAEGKDVWLQGLNICNLSIRPDEEHKILWSAHVAVNDWKANVIRFPVLDSFWFGKGRGKLLSNDPEAYRAIADKVIKIAAAHGAYVVFDLHRYLAPDESCVSFWKDAAARYKNNPAVLFDIINEPHDTTWDVWRNGGPVEIKGKNPHTMQTVGMQALVDTVRGTGAKNIIVAGGLGYAFDLTGVINGYALDEKGGNGIMYATHFYNWHNGWAKHILGVAAKYPVLVGECGADPHKMDFIPADKQEDPYTWAPDAIGFIQKNHLNWTAWCMHTRATPNMLLDWDYYTPTPFWGAFVKDALDGKAYEMKRER